MSWGGKCSEAQTAAHSVLEKYTGINRIFSKRRVNSDHNLTNLVITQVQL